MISSAAGTEGAATAAARGTADTAGRGADGAAGRGTASTAELAAGGAATEEAGQRGEAMGTPEGAGREHEVTEGTKRIPDTGKSFAVPAGYTLADAPDGDGLTAALSFGSAWGTGCTGRLTTGAAADRGTTSADGATLGSGAAADRGATGAAVRGIGADWLTPGGFGTGTNGKTFGAEWLTTGGGRATADCLTTGGTRATAGGIGADTAGWLTTGGIGAAAGGIGADTAGWLTTGGIGADTAGWLTTGGIGAAADGIGADTAGWATTGGIGAAGGINADADGTGWIGSAADWRTLGGGRGAGLTLLASKYISIVRNDSKIIFYLTDGLRELEKASEEDRPRFILRA